MNLDIITPLFGGSGPKRKKTYKYAVVLKGSRLSRHYTKKAAQAAARGVRFAKVVTLGKRRK